MNQQEQTDPNFETLLNDYIELKEQKKITREIGQSPTGEPVTIITMQLPKDALEREVQPYKIAFSVSGVKSIISEDAYKTHLAELAVIKAQEHLDSLRRRSQMLQLQTLMTDVEACLNEGSAEKAEAKK